MSYFGQSRRYVGDPGFFDSIKRIGGAVLKGALGIPGAVAGELLTGRGSARQIAPPMPNNFPPIENTLRGVNLIRQGGSAMAPVNASGCPKGYQPKKVYVPGQGYQRIGPCVKIRTRNQYNKRAATRAAARLSSLGTGMKTIRKSVKSAAKALD